jgi:hypothetical protein
MKPARLIEIEPMPHSPIGAKLRSFLAASPHRPTLAEALCASSTTWQIIHFYRRAYLVEKLDQSLAIGGCPKRELGKVSFVPNREAIESDCKLRSSDDLKENLAPHHANPFLNI